MKTHDKKNGCADPTCSGPADVSVEWIVAPGRPLHYMDGMVLDPKGNKDHRDHQYGMRQETYLCTTHATFAIAGDDPPIHHEWLTAPPTRRKRTVETPRFADNFGL